MVRDQQGQLPPHDFPTILKERAEGRRKERGEKSAAATPCGAFTAIVVEIVRVRC